MVQSEVHLDHHIALPQLPRYQAQILVGLVAFFCFGNSYDGDFVFDDSEAIVNNKVKQYFLLCGSFERDCSIYIAPLSNINASVYVC